MIDLPALRLRTRVAWALAMLVAAGVGVLLLWRADQVGATLSPSVYLVASSGPVNVHIGFRTRTIRTSMAIPAGKSVKLKPGAELDALFPDGHREHWKGPLQLTTPAPKSADANFLNGSLLDTLKVAPPTEAVTTIENSPSNQIRVISPSGTTRFLNPVITWKAKDDLRYDVAVIDLADPNAPPRTLLGMRPPVSVASLQTTQGPQLVPDRIYGVIVRVTGDKAVDGTSRFLTAPDATVGDLPESPALLLEEAFSALTVDPARTGDGWLALAKLPPEWRSSELAVRLRLTGATQLNLHQEFTSAQTEARVLAHR